MIKYQNNFIRSNLDYTPSINRLEAQISYLVNTINDRNEETLPTQSLTIPDSPSHIDRNQESWYLEDFNQDSIPYTDLNLINLKPLTNCQVFTSRKLNLIVNVNPIYNFMIQL